MGDLVVMTQSAKMNRRGPAMGDAAILFFTGVRYERIPELDPALASVTPPRRATKPRRGPAKDDMKRA